MVEEKETYDEVVREAHAVELAGAGEPTGASELASTSEPIVASERIPSHRMIAVYVAIVAVLCLIPSVGLLFGGAEESSDSDAAGVPQLLTDEGAPNVNLLHDAGDWFSDHFAFRNEYVTAAALIEGALFGVSADEGVVYGTNGWLYYSDSIDDFRGSNQLNDRALFDIAHSVRLVQTYALGQGIDFAFAISPNKNTLYGENMPYYYQVHVGDSNLDRITPYLQAEGVNYVDLRSLLEEQHEVLYHKRDSHWNNKGAALASDALLTAVGQPHRDYADEAFTIADDFTGDLDKMLFPSALTPESEVHYDNAPQFDYVTENVQSNFDPKIQTSSGDAQAKGSLVMYRDSFGNALLPFMAEAYGSAYFSRAVPYQLFLDLPAHQADALVIERAQRFMPDMAANPPLMPAPMLTDDQLAEVAGGAGTGFVPLGSVDEETRGDYQLVSGAVPVDDLPTDARIAIRVNGGLAYEAFGAHDSETGEERFQLLVPRSILHEAGNEYEIAIL